MTRGCVRAVPEHPGQGLPALLDGAGCSSSPLRKHSLSLFPREEGQRGGQCQHPHGSHPQHLSTQGFLLFLVQDVSLWLCPGRHWLQFSRLHLLSEFKRLLITNILINPVL